MFEAAVRAGAPPAARLRARRPWRPALRQRRAMARRAGSVRWPRVRPGLRWIDVANDIAFLTMDLAAHERDDLRREALQAWLPQRAISMRSPCCPTSSSIAHWCARRWRRCVGSRRARSSGVRTGRGTLNGPTRSRTIAPPVLVMAGLSGSGKTWFAERIAPDAGPGGALRHRAQAARGAAAARVSASAPDGGLYSLDFNARTYARLRECVAGCLQGGESIVVDAANLRRDDASPSWRRPRAGARS